MDGRDANLSLTMAAAGAAWYFCDELLPQPELPAAISPEPAIVNADGEDTPRHPITSSEEAEAVREKLTIQRTKLV